jgi:hypothetical protein
MVRVIIYFVIYFSIEMYEPESKKSNDWKNGRKFKKIGMN